MRRLAAAASATLVLALTSSATASILFTEVSTAVPGLRLCDLDWIDYDADGDLDLSLVGYPTLGMGDAVAYLFRNDGGTLVDAGLAVHGLGSGMADWADIDDDGDLDLVISGEDLSDTPFTQVYRNDAGTFVELNHSFEGVTQGTSSWYDEDHDGDLDLWLSGTGREALYRNDGSGNFSTVFEFNGGVASGEWSFVDFDADGVPDRSLLGFGQLPIPSSPRYVFGLRRGLADGGTEPFAHFPGLIYADLAWGDLDDDGDLDLVAQGQDSTGANLTWTYHRDGTTFTPTLMPSKNSGDIALGDADNDGDLDLAYGGTNSVNMFATLLYENVGGSFASFTPLAPLAYSSIVWGDYDGDGDLDLAMAGDGPNATAEFHLYRNDTFLLNSPPTAPTPLGVLGNAQNLRLGWQAGTDLETPDAGLSYNLRVGSTPGGIDGVNPHAAADGTRYLTGLGNASNALQFYFEPRGLPGGDVYWSVQSIDHAGGVSAFSQEQHVFLPFTEIYDTADIGGWNTADSDWGDLDGDGRMEYAVSGLYGDDDEPSTRVYFDLEFGGLWLGIGEETGPIQWADADNDGDLDLFVSSRSPTLANQYYRNDLPVGFTPMSSMGLPLFNGGDVAWGDVDNDGDLDLLLESAGLYRNDGNQYVLLPGFEASTYGYVRFCDFDRDGDLDVLHGGDFAGTVEHRILRNDGGGWTELSGGIAATMFAFGAFVDHDGDGDFDVVVASASQAPAIYRNDAGSFVLDPSASAGLPPMDWAQIYAFDMENDGDSDLLFTGEPAGQTQTFVMENVGGTFTNAEAGLPRRDAFGSLGHFDEDNDLDLFLAGQGGGGNDGGIYRNNYAPNQRPNAPTNLSHGINGDDVYLLWLAGNDAETPQQQLTYNVRVGTTPGGCEIVSPMALPDGRRMVARRGNVARPLYRLDMSGITAPVLYWSVQTIDGSYVGSSFAPEQTVVLDPTAVEAEDLAFGSPRIESIAPNPASSRVEIAFRTPSSAPAALHVFDVRGRRVRTLDLGWLPAGDHAIGWDGRDDAGGSVASGTYFCRLESEATSQAKKIVLRR